MFTNFHIERFRGIPELDIDGLKPITLLIGKNNTGKTSVLEAIFLFCGATNPINTVKVGQLRGQRISTAAEADGVWRSLFYGLNPAEPVRITGFINREGQRLLELEALDVTSYSADAGITGAVEANGVRAVGGVRLRYSTRNDSGWVVSQAVFDPSTRQVSAPGVARPDTVPATLLSARSFDHSAREADQYSALVKTRQEQEVVEAVRLIDPSIRRLTVVAEASGAALYADTGGKCLIPLAVCGEGMLRLFSIVLAITSSRDGVVLIDEIDNGLHYTVMDAIWPVLRQLCADYNVQLIATTHNEEMLLDAMEAFRSSPDVFGVFRLDRVGDKLKATSYQGEVLGAVEETGWEIRG